MCEFLFPSNTHWNQVRDTMTSMETRYEKQLKEANGDVDKKFAGFKFKAAADLAKQKKDHELELKDLEHSLQETAEKREAALNKEVENLYTRIANLTGEADAIKEEQQARQQEQKQMVKLHCPDKDDDAAEKLEHLLFGDSFNYSAELDRLHRENKVLRTALRSQKARRTMTKCNIPECKGLDEIDHASSPQDFLL